MYVRVWVTNRISPTNKKSLSKALSLSVCSAGVSFSRSMGEGFRQTVAGIFSRTDMNSKTMLSGHQQQSIARCRADAGEYIVVSQDTTYYNYSTHPSVSGLGVIQGEVRGIMQHNVAAINAQGLLLGVLDQQYWSRQGVLEFSGKESRKWFNGLQAVNECLGGIDKTVVVVQDREADIFDFFQAERMPNIEMVVRVHEPRLLEVSSSGTKVPLGLAGENLQSYGSKEVLIRRSGKDVRLRLRLSGGEVAVCCPDGRKTQNLSLVIAEETGCIDVKTGKDMFNAKERAQWYLLTSLSAASREDVEKILHCYVLRWVVERFHYTLKSGSLNVERLQFDDIHTLVNALVYYSIVAWQLLYVLHVGKYHGDEEVAKAFDEQEIRLLEALTKKRIQTIREGIVALAKTVGFVPTRRQPLPGIKILSEAIERFNYIKIGYQLQT